METNLVLENDQAAIDAIRAAGAEQLYVINTNSLDVCFH